MGKIGDLWVRLGLKSDEYKKGIADAKKQTTGFSQSLSKMKAGALAIWAAIGTAVVAFAKDFISSTNKIGDAWAQTMGGMKQSWQTLKGMLTDGDFKNFGKRMKDAFVGGKEGVKAADEVFEITNKLNIARAKMQTTLNDLYFAMTDPSKTLEERVAAGRKYLSMQKDLYDEEIAMMKRQKENAIRVWLSGTGVNASAADVEKFFAGYTGSAEDEVAKMFPELRNIYENQRGDKTNQPVVDAILAYERALSAYSDENKRIIRQLNTLTAQELGLDDVTDAHSMAVELGKQIASDIQKLNEEFAIIEDIDIDLSDVDNEMKAFLDSWKQDVETIASYNQALEDSMLAAFGNGMQAITDLMMGIEGADMKSVMAAFLAPFADTMKQMGSMIMSEGIAMTAFKKSFSNPAAAIAAGAALIAVGSAVSSGLQRLTANPTGGSAGSTASTGSYGSSELQNYESTLTVEVTGRISGKDIVISGKKTNDYNAR